MEATLTTKDIAFLKSLGLMFDQIRVSRNYDNELWFRLYHKGDIIFVDEAPARLFRKIKLDTLCDCNI